MTEVLKTETISAVKADLVDTACQELLTYGLWDRKTKCKRFIKKYILRKPTITEDLIFWPTGLLAAGLVQCLEDIQGKHQMQEKSDKQDGIVQAAVVQNQIESALSKYFNRWQKKGCPVTYLDDLLAGEVFLKIYEEYRQTKKANGMIDAENAEKYRQAIDKFADYILTYPTDEKGSFLYRANQSNSYIFVDAIGQVCPFLYEYGRIFDKPESMELAVKQITNFLTYGMDAATGLPYHGYEIADGIKYGIIGWGRAVGWLLRGITGCMTTSYGASVLRKPYQELMDAVLAYQRKDGYFSWQLQALEGPADTSATGMICAALKEGIYLGILTGDRYTEALNKGICAMKKSTRQGKVYDCSGECEGFSQYPQRYGAYVWALGTALLLE